MDEFPAIAFELHLQFKPLLQRPKKYNTVAAFRSPQMKFIELARSYAAVWRHSFRASFSFEWWVPKLLSFKEQTAPISIKNELLLIIYKIQELHWRALYYWAVLRGLWAPAESTYRHFTERLKFFFFEWWVPKLLNFEEKPIPMWAISYRLLTWNWKDFMSRQWLRVT